MQLVVLVIHLLVSLCLVGLVLLQRSEGGALGMGGGGGGLVSGRGAADALAKMTSVAGGFFLVTSLSLTFLSGASASTSSRSVFDLLPRQEQTAPAPTPAAPVQPAPTTPDPTESSAPEAAETQLAALRPATAAPAPATTLAPPATAAATRAAPLEARPTPTSTRQPAATSQPPATRQTTTAPATTRPAQTQPRSTPASTAQTPTRSLVLPNTSGSATGLTTPAPTEGESVEIVNGVEAVRRERAGPDQ